MTAIEAGCCEDVVEELCGLCAGASGESAKPDISSGKNGTCVRWELKVKRLGDFLQQLGPPPREPDTSALEQLAANWGVTIPGDVLQVLSAYGDSVIAGQIQLLGPRTLARAALGTGRGSYGVWMTRRALRSCR
jgi:hypothetical protein